MEDFSPIFYVFILSYNIQPNPILLLPNDFSWYIKLKTDDLQAEEATASYAAHRFSDIINLTTSLAIKNYFGYCVILSLLFHSNLSNNSKIARLKKIKWIYSVGFLVVHQCDNRIYPYEIP